MSEAHVTADDLTRLRADDLRETAGEFYPDDRFVAALIDRVERAERERDEWHTHAAHSESNYKRIRDEYAPRYKAWDEFRAAVAGLADEWHIILPEQLRSLLTEGADDGQ